MSNKQKQALLLIFFVFSFLVITFCSDAVYAVTYGSGGFGNCIYGQGCTPTPTSTQTSTSNSTNDNPTSTNSYCGDTKPAGTVDLFQIDRKDKTATLYFTPVQSNTRRYNVVFGFKSGEERYGGLGMESQNQNQGVQALKVNLLNPRQDYYFKVIPINGCASGDWSNWLGAKGRTGAFSLVRKFYRYVATTIFRRK